MQYLVDWLNMERFGQDDLHDLMFDAPILFSRIIDAAISADDKYGFDPNSVWAYEKEIAAISAAQWEAFGGQNAGTKTNRYDYEIQKIKNDLMWAGVQSSDAVEVVFWQENFDPLVSFARRTKRLSVMSLLDAQYDDLREAGFSYDFIAKTSSALREWAEKLLNPDKSAFEQEQSELDINDETDVNSTLNVMSMIKEWDQSQSLLNQSTSHCEPTVYESEDKSMNDVASDLVSLFFSYDADEDFQEKGSVAVDRIDVITLLETMCIKFIDHRTKGGALWILGGFEKQKDIDILKKVGYFFHYKKGGGRASNYEDAWWMK